MAWGLTLQWPLLETWSISRPRPSHAHDQQRVSFRCMPPRASWTASSDCFRYLIKEAQGIYFFPQAQINLFHPETFPGGPKRVRTAGRIYAPGCPHAHSCHHFSAPRAFVPRTCNALPGCRTARAFCNDGPGSVIYKPPKTLPGPGCTNVKKYICYGNLIKSVSILDVQESILFHKIASQGTSPENNQGQIIRAGLCCCCTHKTRFKGFICAAARLCRWCCSERKSIRTTPTGE